MAEDRQLCVNVTEVWWKRKIIRKWYAHDLTVLHDHQFVVQAVGRDRISHAISRTHAGTHQHCEKIIRAVANHDVCTSETIDLSGFIAQTVCCRIWIQTQIATDRLLQGLDHPWRR